MRRKHIQYYPNTHRNGEMVIEQIIDRHIRQLLREEYLREDIREIIREERLYLNEGVGDILRAAKNWNNITSGFKQVVEFCKGSTKYEKLKNVITTVTKGNPASIIEWLIDSRSGLLDIPAKSAQAAQKAAAKSTCKVGGYMFDSAYAEEFNELKSSVGLLFGLVETALGFFGPIGIAGQVALSAFKSLVVSYLSNVTEFDTIVYNVLDQIVIDQLGFSINDVWKKAVEIGEAIENIGRNAISYIINVGKATITGDDSGIALNDACDKMYYLKQSLDAIYNNGTINNFCRWWGANGANGAKEAFNALKKIKYPKNKYTNWFSGLGYTVIAKNNQIDGFWQTAYTQMRIFDQCGFDVDRWISRMASDKVKAYKLTDPNEIAVLQTAIESRLTEYIKNGDFSNAGKPYNYTYQPSRPKTNQVKQKLPPVEHFGGQNFGIM